MKLFIVVFIISALWFISREKNHCEVDCNDISPLCRYHYSYGV